MTSILSSNAGNEKLEKQAGHVRGWWVHFVFLKTVVALVSSEQTCTESDIWLTQNIFRWYNLLYVPLFSSTPSLCQGPLLFSYSPLFCLWEGIRMCVSVKFTEVLQYSFFPACVYYVPVRGKLRIESSGLRDPTPRCLPLSSCSPFVGLTLDLLSGNWHRGEGDP